MASQEMEQLVRRDYKEGFVTDIESDTLPPGLDEEVVRHISGKKGEPPKWGAGPPINREVQLGLWKHQARFSECVQLR